MPLVSTTAGNLIVAGSLAWMTCGILIMRKMINFKF
jgi:tight adherence protein B